MKIKSLFTAMAMFSVVLASCTQLDNPADYEGGTDEPTVITATEVANLTPSFIAAVSGLEEGQELTPGSTFTLTLTPGDILWAGFAPYHMEHIHVHVGDQVYMPEYPADGGENVQQVSLTIPVPENLSTWWWPMPCSSSSTPTDSPCGWRTTRTASSSTA